jgi:hypothetical protein
VTTSSDGKVTEPRRSEVTVSGGRGGPGTITE